MIKITECPRDAMQGIKEFIPTKHKINYINSLLQVGFDTLDFGSFVSPRAIPQLQDTAEVLEKIEFKNTNTKLLAIVASKKGAEIAASYTSIKYLGFPFSFSPTFLQKNINTTLDKAYNLTQEILNICSKKDKQLLQYISMAFGNPYGDEWNIETLYKWVENLATLGIKKITLSDVTGEANAPMIKEIYQTIITQYPQVEFGLHLHTAIDTWKEKINAAYQAGCRSFDTVLNDKGGCPMSGKQLLHNLNTYNLLQYCSENKINHQIDKKSLDNALILSNEIF